MSYNRPVCGNPETAYSWEGQWRPTKADTYIRLDQAIGKKSPHHWVETTAQLHTPSLSLADPWLRHRTHETGSRRHAVYCRDLCEKMDVTWSMTLTPAAPGPDPSPARGMNTEVPGSNSITMPVIEPRVSAYTHVVATRKVLARCKNNFASARRDNHI